MTSPCSHSPTEAVRRPADSRVATTIPAGVLASKASGPKSSSQGLLKFPQLRGQFRDRSLEFEQLRSQIRDFFLRVGEAALHGVLRIGRGDRPKGCTRTGRRGSAAEFTLMNLAKPVQFA